MEQSGLVTGGKMSSNCNANTSGAESRGNAAIKGHEIQKVEQVLLPSTSGTENRELLLHKLTSYIKPSTVNTATKVLQIQKALKILLKKVTRNRN